MSNEWQCLRLSDLSLTCWHRVQDRLSTPYMYSQNNYGIIANQKEVIEMAIQEFTKEKNLSAQVIAQKLQEIKKNDA